jgi:hypothetical protein
LQKILEHLAEKQPKIVLQRVEKIIPAVGKLGECSVFQCSGNKFIFMIFIITDKGVR